MSKKFLRTINIFLLGILMLIQLTSCSTTETQVVNAEIISKEYVESHTDYGYFFDAWKGKFRWKFKTFPDEYNITVQYESVTKTLDNRSLYDIYDIGDFIKMDLTTYYDLEGNIYEQVLSRRN